MQSPKPETKESIKGAAAGRGFRFQDVALALAMTRVRPDSAFTLEPERGDDATIRSQNEILGVQVKSRVSGSFSTAEISTIFKELRKKTPTASSLLVILEQADANVLVLEASESCLLFRCSSASVSGIDAPCYVSYMTLPMVELIEALSTRYSIELAIAAIVANELIRRIGELSNQVVEKPASANAITLGDVELIVADAARLAGSQLQVNAESANSTPVDFSIRSDGQRFLMGRSAQPEDVSSGFAVNRPQSLSDVVSELSQSHFCLIAGPSGSGKSTLMWQAVFAARHERQWLRIGMTDRDFDATVLKDFVVARSKFGTHEFPIGLAVDDVGRGRTMVWDCLVTTCNNLPNVRLLGTCREEDLIESAMTDQVGIVRPLFDAESARSMFEQLSEKALVNSAFGWLEAFEACGNLLLEFVYILTQGIALRQKIEEQIERRAKENRHLELKLLGPISVANAEGASIILQALAQALEIGAFQAREAIKRLIEEHLILESEQGEVSALHPLRSRIIRDILHRYGMPDFKVSLKQAIAFASPATLPAILSVYAGQPSRWEICKEAVVSRLKTCSESNIWRSVFEGLAAAEFSEKLRNWDKATLNELGAARAPAILMFSRMGIEAFKNTPFYEHLSRFKATPTPQLIDEAFQHTIEAGCTPKTAGWDAQSLAYLVALSGPRAEQVFGSIELNLKLLSDADLIDFLGAVRHVSIKWHQKLVAPFEMQLRAKLELEFPGLIIDSVTNDENIDLILVRVQNIEAKDVSNQMFLIGFGALAFFPGVSKAQARFVYPDFSRVEGSGSDQIVSSSTPAPRADSARYRVEASLLRQLFGSSISHYMRTAKSAIKRLEPLLIAMLKNWADQRLPKPLDAEVAELNFLYEVARNLVWPIIGSEELLIQPLIHDGSTCLLRTTLGIKGGRTDLGRFSEELFNYACGALAMPEWRYVEGPPEELRRMKDWLEAWHEICVAMETGQFQLKQENKLINGSKKTRFRDLALHMKKRVIDQLRALALSKFTQLISQFPTIQVLFSNQLKFHAGRYKLNVVVVVKIEEVSLAALSSVFEVAQTLLPFTDEFSHSWVVGKFKSKLLSGMCFRVIERPEWMPDIDDGDTFENLPKFHLERFWRTFEAVGPEIAFADGLMVVKRERGLNENERTLLDEINGRLAPLLARFNDALKQLPEAIAEEFVQVFQEIQHSMDSGLPEETYLAKAKGALFEKLVELRCKVLNHEIGAEALP
jgi:energy-coupling factor transporter ATP-binding protein EcfA2